MNQIAKKTQTTKKQLNALEGLNAQGIPAYKNGLSDYYRGRQIYNSLSDISKSSEGDIKSIIDEARGYLGDFMKEAYESNDQLNKAVGDRATNSVARLQGAADAAGFSKNSTILQQNDVMSQAQLQKAQNTSANQQRIYNAANQFTNTSINAANQNLTNQTNLANLAYTHKKNWNDSLGNSGGNNPSATQSPPASNPSSNTSPSAAQSSGGTNNNPVTSDDTTGAKPAVDYGEPGSRATTPKPTPAPSRQDTNQSSNSFGAGTVWESGLQPQVPPEDQDNFRRDAELVKTLEKRRGSKLPEWEYKMIIDEAVKRGSAVQARNFRELKRLAGY